VNNAQVQTASLLSTGKLADGQSVLLANLGTAMGAGQNIAFKGAAGAAGSGAAGGSTPPEALPADAANRSTPPEALPADAANRSTPPEALPAGAAGTVQRQLSDPSVGPLLTQAKAAGELASLGRDPRAAGPIVAAADPAGRKALPPAGGSSSRSTGRLANPGEVTVIGTRPDRPGVTGPNLDPRTIAPSDRLVYQRPTAPTINDPDMLAALATPRARPGRITAAEGSTAPVFVGDKPPLARGAVVSPELAQRADIVSATKAAPDETWHIDNETRGVLVAQATLPFLGVAGSYSTGLSTRSPGEVRKAYGANSNAEAFRAMAGDFARPEGPDPIDVAASARLRQATNAALSSTGINGRFLRDPNPVGLTATTNEGFQFTPGDLRAGETFIYPSPDSFKGGRLNTTPMTLERALATRPGNLRIDDRGAISDVFGNRLGQVKFTDAAQRARFGDWREAAADPGRDTQPVWVTPKGDIRLENVTGPQAVLGRLKGGDQTIHLLNNNFDVSTGLTVLGVQFGVKLPGMGTHATLGARYTEGQGASGGGGSATGNIAIRVPEGSPVHPVVKDRLDTQVGGIGASRWNKTVGRAWSASERVDVMFNPIVGRFIGDPVLGLPMNAALKAAYSLAPGARGAVEKATGWPDGKFPMSGYPTDWLNPVNWPRQVGYVVKNGPAAVVRPYVQELLDNGQLVTKGKDAEGRPTETLMPGRASDNPDTIKRLVEAGWVIEKAPFTPALTSGGVRETLAGLGVPKTFLERLPLGALDPITVGDGKAGPSAKFGALSMGGSAAQLYGAIIHAWEPQANRGGSRLVLVPKRPDGGTGERLTLDNPGRIVLTGADGDHPRQGFHNPRNDAMADGTGLVLTADGRHAQVPSQVASALLPEVRTWNRHAQAAIVAHLDRLAASTDAALASSARGAKALFEAGPHAPRAGGRITPDQREALRHVVAEQARAGAP
jgi:hypothetical protein